MRELFRHTSIRPGDLVVLLPTLRLQSPVPGVVRRVTHDDRHGKLDVEFTDGEFLMYLFAEHYTTVVATFAGLVPK